MRHVKRITVIFILYLGLLYSQSSYGGLKAWFTASEVALSGGGSALPHVFQPRTNPALLAGNPRSVETYMVRYPANIGAESFSLIIPAGVQTYGFEIRHLGYGIFDGFDEQGFETSSYSANDTWLVGTLGLKSGEGRFKLGISGGILRSQIQNYLSYALTGSIGFLWKAKSSKTYASGGLRNLGAVMRSYTKKDQAVPSVLFLGLSRELKYLPLNIGVDLLLKNEFSDLEASLAAALITSNEITVLASVSSNRVQQTTDFVYRNYISSMGVGIIYSSKGISVKSGAHFIGPGGLVVSAGVSMGF